MKTITIRDLRQRWPEVAAALQVEDEIIITRESRPVAKLVKISQPAARRKRWDPAEHMARMRKIFGDKVFPSSDALLAADRNDRKM